MRMLENLSTRQSDPLPSKATKSICITHKRDSHVARKDFSPRNVTWSISEKSPLLLHDIHGCFITTNNDDSLGSLLDREYRSICFSQLCELEGGAKWPTAKPLKTKQQRPDLPISDASSLQEPISEGARGERKRPLPTVVYLVDEPQNSQEGSIWNPE